MHREARKNVAMSFGALVVLTLSASGCGTAYVAVFSPPVMQESVVVLRENDFRYVERNIEGSYSYWALWIGYPPLILQIPLGDPRLFSNALAEMYSKSKSQAEGKTTQLINWTLDRDDLMLPLFMRKTATFRTDLIEYTK